MQNSSRTLFSILSSDDEPKHIAVIGSGGKTGTVLKLAEEIQSAGRTVLITATTKMWLPDAPVAQTAEEAGRRLAIEPAVWAGKILPEEGKLTALPEEEQKKLTGLADVILTEADGSRGFPLKYPRQDEPVIPKTADHLVLVLGLDCLGKPIREVCHHPEWIPLSLVGTDDEIVTPRIAAGILTDGYIKRKIFLPYTILLNASEREPEEKTIRELTRLLPPCRCVIRTKDGFKTV